jgi:hypothetical protein
MLVLEDPSETGLIIISVDITDGVVPEDPNREPFP